MKITVDTDTDSHEDIKKIITLLQEKISSSSGALNIFGDNTSSTSSTTIFESSSPTPSSESSGNNVFNIFEQPVESEKSSSETVDGSSTPTGFFETLDIPEKQEEEEKREDELVEEQDEAPMIDIFDLEEY